LEASIVNFAAISAHLAEMLFDPLLAVFKRLTRYRTPAAKGDENNQTTNEKGHPADEQRQTNRAIADPQKA
jgi:hypothetical protein